MAPVELPKANENLTEATLDRWLVQEGQAVSEKQGLCVLITDKATFELPAPTGGVVRRIYQRERGMLPVGYILCALGAPDEPVPEAFEEQNRQTLAAHRSAAVTVRPAPGAAGSGDSMDFHAVPGRPAGSVRATPAARRLAREAGVELAVIAHTLGLSGPVGEKDVRTFLERRGK
jgi:pyruvate/2-oxoglutarate dehydrogenase complex dihydrolipoamide acyltransferase (E2) component